jgi:exonuclease III
MSGIKSITNRIAVLRFTVTKTARRRRHSVTIINAYAPHSLLARENPAELTSFYATLEQTYQKYKNTSTVIVAGDFNAKLGLRADPQEQFMGAHGKGTRNASGHHLVDFLADLRLYATNTTFDVPHKHRTTWQGPSLRTRHIYNQIDYIFLPIRILRRHPNVIRSSRSYLGTIFNSDHRLVITSLRLNKLRLPKTPRLKPTQHLPFDPSILATDEFVRNQFQNQIAAHIFLNPCDPQNPDATFQALATRLLQSATELCPRQCTSNIHGQLRFNNDPKLTEWTTARSNLRKRASAASCTPQEKAALLRDARQIGKQISHRTKKLHNERVNRIAKYLELNKGNKRSFEALRLLRKHTYRPFQLIDADGHTVTNAEQAIPLLQAWYQNFFNQEGMAPTPLWPPDVPPSPLDPPITTEEVTNAAAKLNNGRATGKDGIPGEFIKYGGTALHAYLTDMLNSVFATHTKFGGLLDGLLIALNKPNNKPKTAANTRPITLLNTIRKLLSLIVLERIYPYISNFVSINQSGFRRGRSTADLLWAYRWMGAITQRYQTKFHILGIDLSKAFDCIDRSVVLAKLRELLPLTEYRILHYLLSETTLEIRVNGTHGPSFATTIGTPQGDALSPIIFIVYLELALQDYYRQHPRALQPGEDTTHYADDTDFISLQLTTNEYIQQHLPAALQRYNLQMNPDKSEHITIERATFNTLTNKKLGSKLGPTADITYRITQANNALHSMNKMINNRRHISVPLKVRMYNACVRSVMTYNLSCMAASATELLPLAAAHRRHLRRLLCIYYPETISNDKLYQRTRSLNILLDTLQQRWHLLGHILRSSPDIPAYKYMHMYFSNPLHFPAYRGRYRSSLPVILDIDLRRIQRRLHTAANLEELRTLAQDRQAWRSLITDLRQAYDFELRRVHPRPRRAPKRRLQAVVIQSPSRRSPTDGPPLQRIRLLAPRSPSPAILRIPRRHFARAHQAADHEAAPPQPIMMDIAEEPENHQERQARRNAPLAFNINRRHF